MPDSELTLGLVEAFFLSGPTRGLAVISLFDPYKYLTIKVVKVLELQLQHQVFQ